ncbi:MAG: hypothetical protein LBF09_06175 [Odoribacteraceae bacterium]|jgi:hypothetical protein|nr:hypothetical protein [Odoribacteraceae bacterium]
MKPRATTTTCILLFLFSSCLQRGDVQLNGRVEGKDSVIIFRRDDREFRFRVTSNAFSGRIPLQESAYVHAHLLPSYRGILLFLAPGEHLEITVNATPAFPQFEGRLAAINNYLAEQARYLPLRPGTTRKDEETFVKELEEQLRVRVLLLEAKNLGSAFTGIESERIGYLIAEYALRYAAARARLHDSTRYRPGARLRDFISRFPVDNEKMADVREYLQFVLAYYTLETEQHDNFRDVTADIIARVTTRKIKEYLLSELVSARVYREGLKDGDYLLSLCRQEINDTSRLAKVERVAEGWRKLSAGTTAPDIVLRGPDGVDTRLREMRGSFLYIVANDSRRGSWPPDPAVSRAIKKHAGGNIRFLHLVFDPSMTFDRWKEYAGENDIPWEHFLIVNWREFHASYLVSTFPRYILIDPRGRVVTALASPGRVFSR